MIWFIIKDKISVEKMKCGESKRKIKYEVEGEKGVFNSLSYVVEENRVKLFCNIIFSFLSEHNLDKVLYEEFKY